MTAGGEIVPKKRFHAVMPLLKARVTILTPADFTMSFGYEHGSPTTIKVAPVAGMGPYDVRLGDLLTIYTEVLFKQQGNA